MRLPRALGATAGACALVMGAAGSAGSAGPVIASSAPPSATVLIAPDIVHVNSPAATGNPPTTAECEKAFHLACYSPVQIEQAYGIPTLRAQGVDGRGQTIVIVDSFGSPTIWNDLRMFDSAYHLPPAALSVIQPAGPVPAYQATSNREGWAGETSLDVEYAHAMAPGARILLVETPTAENEGTTGFPQIVQAEKYVIDHHLGDVISQSFSATEETFPSAQSLRPLRVAYTDAQRNGVTVLAAAGDSGAADLRRDGSTYYLTPVTSWPDSDPLVTGVGGTQLHLNAAGQPTSQATVWNDTWSKPTNQFIFGTHAPNPLAGGGGRSAFFSRPWYQDGVQTVVGRSRGVPDIAMSAACNGAVNVYQSFKGGKAGWYQVCGTSEATPLFAGVVALADQVAGHRLGLINPRLYELLAHQQPGLRDIDQGNNTVAFSQGGRTHTVSGFTARHGYDLASGVGTVYAPQFVWELAGKTPTQAAPSHTPQAHPSPTPTPTHSGLSHPSTSHSGSPHLLAHPRDHGHLTAPTTQIP